MEGLLCRWALSLQEFNFTIKYCKDVSRKVIVVPTSLIHTFLRMCHDVPGAGHQVFDKTLARVQEEAYWVGMTRDVNHHCITCEKCQAAKLNSACKAPMQNVPVGLLWQMVAVDILEVPLSIQDQGRNFESTLLRSTLKAFGVEKTRMTAYHPQGDGMVERANRSILQMLRTFVEKKTDWERTPFEVMFGRTQSSSVFPGKDRELDGYDPNEYKIQLRQKLAELYEIVEANIVEAAEIQKQGYYMQSKEQTFIIGDQVWLSCPTAGKLDNRWEAGWEVTEMKGPVTICVKHNDGRRFRTVHVNRLRHRRGREMESIETNISHWQAPKVDHEFIASEEEALTNIAINPGPVELEQQQLEGTGSNLRRSGRNRKLPDRYGVPISDY
ncbi:hypothetical protein EMCRGX_G024851 [Ephydatia muelleri]